MGGQDYQDEDVQFSPEEDILHRCKVETADLPPLLPRNFRAIHPAADETKNNNSPSFRVFQWNILSQGKLTKMTRSFVIWIDQTPSRQPLEENVSNANALYFLFVCPFQHWHYTATNSCSKNQNESSTGTSDAGESWKRFWRKIQTSFAVKRLITSNSWRNLSTFWDTREAFFQNRTALAFMSTSTTDRMEQQFFTGLLVSTLSLKNAESSKSGKCRATKSFYFAHSGTSSQEKRFAWLQRTSRHETVLYSQRSARKKALTYWVLLKD